jgi:hypothetical protein
LFVEPLLHAIITALEAAAVLPGRFGGPPV